METPNNQEITKILSENPFQQLGTTLNQAQKVPQIPQAQQQAQEENKEVQIPPQEEKEEFLLGIYLKKEKNSIDYAYNKEQIPLILYNKNIIIGMLENIKLDILLGEKGQNE